jgi:hypothetical protein
MGGVDFASFLGHLKECTFAPLNEPGWNECTRFRAGFVCVWLSTISDVAALTVLRKGLRYASLSRSSVQTLMTGLSVGGAFVVITLPIVLLTALGNTGDWSGHPYREFASDSGEIILLLNADIVFFLAGLVLVVALMLLHHLLWPTVLRFLYSVQGNKLLENRKAMASLGIMFGLLALGREPLEELFKAIAGLFA